MSVEEAKKKAVALLDKRDFSRGELIAKLREKGFEEAEAETAVERFVELGYVSDTRYAAMVVRHYAGKGFGAARIREELRRRYIPRDMWDEALESLPEQEETVDALLRSKLKRFDSPDKDDLHRASEALRRRGFSWDEVSAAVERFKSERNDI